MKYFLKRGLEIFQNFYEIFKYFKVKYFIVHLYMCIPRTRLFFSRVSILTRDLI